MTASVTNLSSPVLLSQHSSPAALSPVVIALRTTFITLFSILVILGNTFATVVVHRITDLADSTRVLMKSLASVDLLVGVYAIPTIVASSLNHWPFGSTLCHLQGVTALTGVTLSVCIICLLNVERYIAITRPFKFPVWCEKKRVVFGVGISSLICFSLVVIRITFIQEMTYIPATVLCIGEHGSPLIEISLTFSFAVFPCLLMIFIYSKFIRISRQHVRMIQLQGLGAHHQQQQQRGAPRTTDRKAVRVFLVVTVTFAFCWLPIQVSRTYAAFSGASLSDGVVFVTTWLAACNSFLNVFIYYMFNSSFRSEAKRVAAIIRRACSKRSAVGPVDV